MQTIITSEQIVAVSAVIAPSVVILGLIAIMLFFDYQERKDLEDMHRKD